MRQSAYLINIARGAIVGTV
ncbi:MAG: hypothetical protein V7K50_29450 [Nostoc sp.]